MPLPRPSTVLEGFFTRLAAAPRRVLLLDFDGTLAPFALRPQDARPYEGISALLDAIMAQRENRVVIVTGRSLAQCAPDLGLQRPPEIWGAHGWQWLPPAGPLQEVQPLPEERDRLFDAAARVQTLACRGARIERKTASVALHWRGLDAPTVDALRSELGRVWRGFARHGGFELMEFDGGVELRVRGRSKGSVVRHVLAESGAGVLAAYLGDDRTDEEVFSAVRGRGPGVLVRPAWRRTQATLWLRPPEGVAAFLERWRDCRHAPCRAFH